MLESVAKTNRVALLHEDTRRGGMGGELAARIVEGAFYELDAPIVRITAPDTPVPYSPGLEKDYLVDVERVSEELLRLVAS